jgi:hypothetical protein
MVALKGKSYRLRERGRRTPTARVIPTNVNGTLGMSGVGLAGCAGSRTHQMEHFSIPEAGALFASR